ncbi:MAG: hypothetical protein AAF357_12155, partial [Verrucomicrobiota bacterium]
MTDTVTWSKKTGTGLFFTPYSQTENFELEWEFSGEHDCQYGQDASLDFSDAGFRYGSDRFPNQNPKSTSVIPVPALKKVPIKKTPGNDLPTSVPLTENYEVVFDEGSATARQCPERSGMTAVGTVLEKREIHGERYDAIGMQ